MSLQPTHEPLVWINGSQGRLGSHDTVTGLWFGPDIQGPEEIAAVSQEISTAPSNVWPTECRNGKYQEQLMFQAGPVPRRLQDDNSLQTQRPIGIGFNVNLTTNEAGTSTSHPIKIQVSTGPYEKMIEASNLWPTRPGSAWRNFSYTDLITLAILSTSDRRITVKEIYAWVARNIPHFDTKKYDPAASGWKNTIRHTLSIRKRFVRIPTQMERRSLWTIKPEYLQVVIAEISQKMSADSSFVTPDYDHIFYPGYSSLPWGGILIPRPSSFHGKF